MPTASHRPDIPRILKRYPTRLLALASVSAESAEELLPLVHHNGGIVCAADRVRKNTVAVCVERVSCGAVAGQFYTALRSSFAAWAYTLQSALSWMRLG